MNNIISLRPSPDPAAQELWGHVAEASDRVSELMDEIPAVSVRGEDTRRELAEAHTLLTRVIEVLRRVEGREVPRYAEFAGGQS